MATLKSAHQAKKQCNFDNGQLEIRRASHFTNISLQESIYIAINLIFNDNPNLTTNKKNLKNSSDLQHHRFIPLVTVNFIIKLMKQPWTLPWFLSLLTFSWVFYESKLLNECNLNRPKFYLRHIHGIAALFEKEDLLNFLDFLNNKHPNIKFTMEKQVNHSISFFDVFIWYR